LLSFDSNLIYFVILSNRTLLSCWNC